MSKQRYKPTPADKEHGKAMAKQLEECCWASKEDKDEHLAYLRKTYGSTWRRTIDRTARYDTAGNERPQQSTVYPSVEQIYNDPLWKDITNLACIPKHYLPEAMKPNARIAKKRKFDKILYAQGAICQICTKSKVVVSLPCDKVRCLECYGASLEYVYFAFNPLSPYTAMDPSTAVFLIDKALNDGLSVCELSSMLHADHATDDDDPSMLYNRKVENYSQITNRKERYQEIEHGKLRFLDANSHGLKTFQCGDCGRGTMSELRKSREAATLKHVRALNVDHIFKITEHLYHPKTGGFNFNLREFLLSCRPRWLNQTQTQQQEG